MRAFLTTLFTITLTLLGGGLSQGKADAPIPLVFSCSPQNDLYRVLGASASGCPRFDTAAEAIKRAPDGAGVLVLADGYPEKTTAIDTTLSDKAKAKHLRLYIEYPSSLPGLKMEKPRKTSWERAVVSSDLFGPALEKGSILAIQGCHFVPTRFDRSHIVVARVAGLNTAVYGIPKEAFPILFEHPNGYTLVATTQLSRFVSGRYAPEKTWSVVWETILSWVSDGAFAPTIQWAPIVRPWYPPTVRLPRDAEARAFRRGVDWFIQSGLLDQAPPQSALADPTHFKFIPAQRADELGRYGIQEGYNSHIRYDGSQQKQGSLRSDCNGESAMALAFGGKVEGDEIARKIAENILNFWFFNSIAQKGVRADSSHPAFGLVTWGISSPGLEIAYYGDDNARFLLGSLAAASLLQSDRWDKSALKCLLANLRTTGALGFRPNRIDLPDLEANGWRHYFIASPISYAPHYQAYLWACYLWAYHHTGYSLFLERAKKAIEMTMAAYPDQWRWTNGIAQERARMLLPLAWLARVEDTAEHRQWLRHMAAELLKTQDACGAIREELGAPERGRYGPPRSNEEYGKKEATLIQKNGDPVCDFLYTSNFAFLGLHEAAAATGDRFYADAEEKLAKFLCRIQVHSEKFPELSGAWFRAFDFRKWEYWGSSADAGWGPWCIETGWTQSWIVSVLGLRQMQTSLWDLTADSQINKHFTELKPLFIPE